MVKNSFFVKLKDFQMLVSFLIAQIVIKHQNWKICLDLQLLPIPDTENKQLRCMVPVPQDLNHQIRCEHQSGFIFKLKSGSKEGCTPTCL